MLYTCTFLAVYAVFQRLTVHFYKICATIVKNLQIYAMNTELPNKYIYFKVTMTKTYPSKVWKKFFKKSFIILFKGKTHAFVTLIFAIEKS